MEKQVTRKALMDKLFEILSSSLEKMDPEEPDVSLLKLVKECLHQFKGEMQEIPLDSGEAKGILKKYQTDTPKEPEDPKDDDLPF